MPKPSGDARDKPRVLILSPESPWPLHGGGAIRTASLADYFGRHAILDLVLFRERGGPESHIPAGLADRVFYIDLPVHRRDPLSRAARNAYRYFRSRPPLIDRFSRFKNDLRLMLLPRHYDLTIVEHFWCAACVDMLRPLSDEIWIDLHNIESEWHQNLQRQSPPIMRVALSRFAQVCRRLEQSLLPRFDIALVASDVDAAAVQNITHHLHTVVYPNALQWRELPDRREEDVIAFTGNLEYQPNIGAVRFFRSQIWPQLRALYPQLRWRVIGRNPGAVEQIVRGDDRIELVGPVEDAVAELSRAKLSVVPLLAGSGTRLKILEAWAAGTPVVSTTIGARGLDAASGSELMIADEPEAFAATITGLLSSQEQRLKISAAGRRVFERRYTWESAWRALPSHSSKAMLKLLSLYTG